MSTKDYEKGIEGKEQMFGWIWFTLLYSIYLHRWLMSPGKRYRVTIADLIQTASLPMRALYFQFSMERERGQNLAAVHAHEWFS